MAIADIKAPRIRRWHKRLADAGIGEPTMACAYQLLKSIFNTAVDDDAIRRNPCRIERGAVNDTPERSNLTMAEVFAVAGEVPVRYRVLVLLATFASLRWGELVALERQDIDFVACMIRIARAGVELDDGTIVVGPPKSKASVRTVLFPELLTPDLGQHLADFVPDCPEGRVFSSWEGALLRRANFQMVWAEARGRAGPPGVRFHDLRHTGNTLASQTGATLKELMHRMGHSTVRAAMIYQHSAPGRDQKIAEGLDGLIADMKAEKDDDPDRADTD
jgi:integrase